MCQRSADRVDRIDSGLFWSSLLDDNMIRSDDLKTLIRHVLAIPTGKQDGINGVNDLLSYSHQLNTFRQR